MPDAQDDDMTGRPAGTMGSPPGSPKQKYFLSMLTPVRDEESYLIEFINYYLIQGVDHFYFYDNDSKIPVTDVIREYRDCCTVMTAPGDAVQRRASLGDGAAQVARALAKAPTPICAATTACIRYIWGM